VIIYHKYQKSINLILIFHFFFNCMEEDRAYCLSMRFIASGALNPT
jgi:hypothetical protein